MISHIWNLKYDTKERIYETETDIQTQRTDVVAKGEVGVEKGQLGGLGLADANCYLQNG